MAWIPFLFSILSGAANPFQSAANAQLNKQLHAPIWTAVMVYMTGLLGMLIVEIFVQQPLPVANAGHVSWWAWTGGIISILSTVAGLLLVQRLGSGIFTALSITASLVVSVLLDQFGLMGLRQHQATPGRWIGCALLVAGVWLVSRS